MILLILVPNIYHYFYRPIVNSFYKIFVKNGRKRRRQKKTIICVLLPLSSSPPSSLPSLVSSFIGYYIFYYSLRNDFYKRENGLF